MTTKAELKEGMRRLRSFSFLLVRSLVASRYALPGDLFVITRFADEKTR